MRLSRQKEYAIDAYNQGYRVYDGKIINIYTGNTRSPHLMSKGSGYYIYRFSIRPSNAKYTRCSVYVHQLLAYQKYGMKAFEDGVVVRHLDGNSLNNMDENVVIGSQSDNMMDRSPDKRLEHSIKASTTVRKFSDEVVAKIKHLRQEGYTYKQLMDEFNISSKGTLHYILNTEYQTKV